jgi:hypothetical protein
MEVTNFWWSSRSSKPWKAFSRCLGGFDSHPLPLTGGYSNGRDAWARTQEVPVRLRFRPLICLVNVPDAYNPPKVGEQVRLLYGILAKCRWTT